MPVLADDMPREPHRDNYKKKREQNGTCFTWSLGRLVGRQKPGPANETLEAGLLGTDGHRRAAVSASLANCSFYYARGKSEPKMGRKKKVTRNRVDEEESEHLSLSATVFMID